MIDPVENQTGGPFLIEKDGERSFVNSLEAYEGWTVLSEGDAARPIDDGEWSAEGWKVPLAVLQRRKGAALVEQMEARLRAGYAPSHPDLAGHRLQLRNEKDKSNWLTSQGVYSTMVALGKGAEVKARFRTADNAVKTVSYADGLNILLGMAGWGEAIMARSWALKDAVASATVETIDTIDLDAGWPA